MSLSVQKNNGYEINSIAVIFLFRIYALKVERGLLRSFFFILNYSLPIIP